jgi:hypothetical protein
VITARGKPLDLVFIRTGAETQKLGYAAVEFACGVRIVELAIDTEFVVGGVPAGATAEVAGAIQRQHYRLIESRSKVRGGGVGDMVFHDHDLCLGEKSAKTQVQRGSLAQ